MVKVKVQALNISWKLNLNIMDLNNFIKIILINNNFNKNRLFYF